jgi:transcriptional regulator with XRE-family HTH domain
VKKKERISLMSKAEKAMFNSLLREERLRHHWSQQELADRLGTTKITVRRWEHSTTTPSPYFRLKLIAIFGKSFEELGFEQKEAQLGIGVLSEQSDTTDEVEKESQLLIETTPEQQSSNIYEADQASSPPVETLPEFQLFDTDVVEQIILSESAQISPLEEDADLPSPFHNTQQRGKHYLLSRRSMMAGLGAGLAVALGGSLWLNRTFAFSAKPTGPTTKPTIPSIVPLYTYQVPPPFYINDVSWSSQGTMLACAIGDKTVQIHQAATGNVSLIYRGHHGYIDCAQWQPLSENRVASASNDTTVQIWDAITGHCQLTYRGHSKSVSYLAWSHDGTRIASGGRDATVQIWDAFTGKRVTTYTGHKGSVWSIRWNPTDDTIVSAGDDGLLHVWYVTTGKPSFTFVYAGPPDSTINEVDWSPDGRWIVSAHADSHVYIWDASTGDHVLTYSGHTASVRTARWAPDGKHIASGGVDDTVQIWDAMTGQKRLFTKNNTDDILEVAWSPDGKRLASASKDQKLQVSVLHF